jgi:LPS export ABC transporter protein LptC
VNRRQLALALLLVLLAIASFQLLRQQQTQPVTDTGGAPVPEAFARDIKLDILNQDGKRVYQLRASMVEYYPDNDLMQLQEPRLELERHDGSHWLLLADSGHTGQACDPVWLRGNVTIQQLEAKSGNPLQISTRDVLVRTGARLAETAEPAVITGKGFRLDTNGLGADFNTNHLELRSTVRGVLNETE